MAVSGEINGWFKGNGSYTFSIANWPKYNAGDVVQFNRKHKKRVNMKHKLTVLLSLVAIAAVGTFAVVRHNHYAAWRDLQTVKAHAAVYIQQKEAQAAQAKQKAAINSLESQCAKDHATYVALTPAQRAAKGAVTDCNPNLQIVQ